MINDTNITISGKECFCTLFPDKIVINGNYYRYTNNKRIKESGLITVNICNVMRVGFTKTYSRLMFLFPMCFGFTALIIKEIPALEYKIDIIPGIYSVGTEFWSLPYQDTIWKIFAILCLLTIPLYWLSYRNDLEINAITNRYLLPAKGVDKTKIAYFQSEFARLKKNRK